MPADAALSCADPVPPAPAVVAQDACDPNPSVTLTSVTTPGACPQEMRLGGFLLESGGNAPTVVGSVADSVLPISVRTELAAQVFAELPDLYEDQLARVPKRRMCGVEEVAAAVVYLVSAEADFTTGSVLTVDGGYLAL